MAEKIYYFGYGRNVDESEMHIRCKDAELIGKAVLKGRRFIINSAGVATMIEDEKSAVEGVLWSISPNDLKALDIFEGVRNNFYSRHTLPVVEEKTNIIYNSFVYISGNTNPGIPGEGYIEIILKSADKLGFSAQYIAHLKKFITKKNNEKP